MKIRQGKDIVLRWKVLTNGQDVSLEGRKITLVMTTPLGREKVVEHEVEGSVVKAHLLGKTLMHLGDYTLTLWENRGVEGQTAVDAVNAFTLVQYSTQEDNGSPCGNLEYEVAELATANMDVITSNEVVIESVEVVDNLESDATDKALSARQGKVLKGMIPTQVSELENDEGYITEIPEGYATKDDVSEAVSGKQDALTLTVKDNGNIVIGNISGQSKEFMPSTPSGDPMHYAYVSAGAEYNATDQIIQRTAPWGTDEKWEKNEDGTYTHWREPAIVEHLPGHWYLNGIGDITNEEMRDIYTITFPSICSSTWAHLFRNDGNDKNPKTNLVYDNLYSTGQVKNISAAFYNTRTNIVRISGQNSANRYAIMLPTDLSYAFYNSNLTHIIGVLGLSQDSNNTIKAAGNFRNITHFQLKGIKSDITIFKTSSLIEKRSLEYMIANATPTSAITITLHADAYARLAEDADIVAALEAQPLVTLVSA